MKKQPVSIGRDDLLQFPGLYAPASDGDEYMRRRLVQRFSDEDENAGWYRPTLEHPLTDHGVADPRILRPSSLPVVEENLHKRGMLQLLDLHWRVEADYRLRWVRCFLDTIGLPFDREPIVLLTEAGETIWIYESEATSEEIDIGRTVDPIDDLLSITPPLSSQWYAVKLLAHIRRIETLSDQPRSGEAMWGLAREWCLFGETWAEANFVITQGEHAIKGQKKIQQVSNAGRAPKRRKWADVLAGGISAWEDIPDESYRPLTIDHNGIEYGFFRDVDEKGRECVRCVDMDFAEKEIGTLARSTFEKRYMK